MQHLPINTFGTVALPLTFALALTSCDAAIDQVGGQVRGVAVEKCRQASETIGVAADLVQPVCECTADDLMSDGAQIAQIDQQRVREAVRECLAQTEPAATDNSTG